MTRCPEANDLMKMTGKLFIVFLLILPIGVPWSGTGIVYSQNQVPAADAGKPSMRRSTGWFKRPAGAGDFQEVVDLPNLERPEAFVNSLPTTRDLPALCRAQTRAYDE